MQEEGNRQIQAFPTATRRLINLYRLVLTEATPYVMTGGVELEVVQLLAGGRGASKFDADLIHLVFERGAEFEGPIKVMVSMSRMENVVFFRRDAASGSTRAAGRS